MQIKKTHSPINSPCTDSPTWCSWGCQGNTQKGDSPCSMQNVNLKRKVEYLIWHIVYENWRHSLFDYTASTLGAFARLPWSHVLKSLAICLGGQGLNLDELPFFFWCKVYPGGHVQIWWVYWFHWLSTSKSPYLCAPHGTWKGGVHLVPSADHICHYRDWQWIIWAFPARHHSILSAHGHIPRSRSN